jgi:hypothetical protein
MVVCVAVLPTQALPTARIGLSGKLLSQLDHPVTLVVRLPPGYGLTAWERRTGWEPLNDESRVEVPLGDSPFVARLPPVKYCTQMWLWQRVAPAPPARFVLHFSDAPGEEYVIWGSLYIVLDAEHHEIRQDIAGWRLEIGPLRYRGGLGRDALWLLDVSLISQRVRATAEASCGAAPPIRSGWGLQDGSTGILCASMC